MIYGIDVAKWQGVIDWSKVATTNKKFAIIKVTNKDNKKESQFENNIASATTHGIIIGVYRYVYAKSVEDAKNEALAIVSALNGRKLPLGVWLDMEDKSIRGIGKARLTDIINTEAKILQKAGYNVGIYCNKDWYYNVLDYKALRHYYPFWIARYSVNDNGTEPQSLNPSTYGIAWQYSSKGSVAGINGNVDLDILFCDIPEVYKPEAANYTLKSGNLGAEVALLQRNLNYFGANLVVDGAFGEKTKAALIDFQKTVFPDDEKEHDGIYGVKTYRKMRGLL